MHCMEWRTEHKWLERYSEELWPPWDPIMIDAKRLGLNQLFVGLTTLLAFVRQQKIQDQPLSPETFESYD
jgi:hypothetical protein